MVRSDNTEEGKRYIVNSEMGLLTDSKEDQSFRQFSRKELNRWNELKALKFRRGMGKGLDRWRNISAVE